MMRCVVTMGVPRRRVQRASRAGDGFWERAALGRRPFVSEISATGAREWKGGAEGGRGAGHGENPFVRVSGVEAVVASVVESVVAFVR